MIMLEGFVVSWEICESASAGGDILYDNRRGGGINRRRNLLPGRYTTRTSE